MLTKSQEEFIGNTFPTPKGGVLTVVGVNGRRGSHTYFELRCSICSEDEELWPKGSICDYKSHITSGRVTCGCVLNPKWKKDQYTLRIKRACAERGYEFKGFSGEWLGVNTKLTLFNKSTGNTWSTTSILNFFSGNGDPSIKVTKLKERSLLDDSEHRQHFAKAGFGEGYFFWRSNKLNINGCACYWNYRCPVCSEDEYVQHGLCSGVFEAHAGSLKNGIKSCRCGYAPNLTKAQKEFKLNKICESEHLTYYGLKDSSKFDNRSKFKWVCKEGHECCTSIETFCKGTRCSKCHRNEQKAQGYVNGYYEDKQDVLDFLYCILFKKGGYIKVGRTFDIEKRITHTRTGLLVKSNHEYKDIEILSLMQGTHKEVYKIEQDIHRDLTARGFYHKESSWTIETFDKSCSYILNKLLISCGLAEVKHVDLELKC